MKKRSEATTKPTTPEPAESSSALEEPKRRAYDFKSVNARKESHLRPDLAAIVETGWVEDMNKLWKCIKAALPIGERRSEHGFLVKRLDEFRVLSYEAHNLYVTAKREEHRWELENEVTNAAMWNEASRELETEKSDKLRSKAITEADVRAKIMVLHPDEFVAQETRRKALKLTVEDLTYLVKVVAEGCEDTRVMLAKLRS